MRWMMLLAALMAVGCGDLESPTAPTREVVFPPQDRGPDFVDRSTPCIPRRIGNLVVLCP